MAKRNNQQSFRVAVIGESAFDTQAMRDLLARRFSRRVQFISMPVRLAGGQLDGQKARTMFALSYRDKHPDLVVIFRDLDGPASDKAKMKEREHFFQQMNALIENKGLLLVHIYAIEALLIAHIEVFQQRYGWNCRVPANPTTIPDPAQFLRNASRNSKLPYSKALCHDFMALVDYEVLVSRCHYFAAFDQEFSRRIPAE